MKPLPDRKLANLIIVEPVENKDKAKLVKDIVRIATVALFFVALIVVLEHPFVRTRIFDVENWRSSSQAMGTAGGASLFILFSLANAMGVPRLWICAIAGGLYGAAQGIAVAYPATIIGATINFFLGRWMLRGPLKRRLPARINQWQDRLTENGFYWLLFMRFFPFSNGTMVNLISGASRMRFRDFQAATWIGYLPFTITFALFGSSAAKGAWHQFGWGLLVFCAVIGARWLYGRKRGPSEFAPH